MLKKGLESLWLSSSNFISTKVGFVVKLEPAVLSG